MLYTVPLALGGGVGAALLLSSDPTDRQLGSGVLLMLAAGYAPKSPAPLLMMVLGLALVGRSAMAHGFAALTRPTAEMHAELRALDRSLDQEPSDEP